MYFIERDYCLGRNWSVLTKRQLRSNFGWKILWKQNVHSDIIMYMHFSNKVLFIFFNYVSFNYLHKCVSLCAYKKKPRVILCLWQFSTRYYFQIKATEMSQVPNIIKEQLIYLITVLSCENNASLFFYLWLFAIWE